MSPLLRLARRNLGRRPGRTALTAGGVAFAMLLLVLTGSLEDGIDRALDGSEAARTLVVYRKNRYCPQTSFLPEWYAERIRRVPGVTAVLPVKVFLNNCRASLDLVTFLGAPADGLLASRGLRVIEGDGEAFRRVKDAALAGRAFAARKGLSVGDQFRFGGVDVKVVGVVASGEPTDEGVIYTHLEYLQRAGPVDRLGTVTQFDVTVAEASRAREVATAIDALFKDAEAPTDTRSKTSFLEAAVKDLRELLRFGAALASICVLVVLALVAGAVLMSAQERVREFGVLRTLGYRGKHVALVVLLEACALSLAGGAFGVAAGLLIVRLGHVSFGAEGVAVELSSDPALALRGLGAALLAGAAAGLGPAWRASRAEPVDAIRGN
ncbi:MAG TPA: ABC transporter permease [Planctomycetota bacterium]|nr:ABC transporter permease [Planctomycetota bacterium]